MRILLLTMYYAPDITANATIMTQLAQELHNLGHDVTVVTTFPHYSTNRIWESYQGQIYEWDRHNGTRVGRTYLYVPPEKNDIVGRILNYLSFNALSTFMGIQAGEYDVILAPSPPLTIGLTAYTLSELRDVPYIYNVQDIYPDVAVRLGVLTNPTVVSLFKKLEQFVYRNAAAVSVISRGFRRNLLAKDVPDDKVHVIPNFVEPEFVRPLPRQNAFSHTHNLDDKYVVLYAGNVGLSQGLEYVLQTAQRLSDIPDILFLIVGNGAAKAELIDQAERMGLDTVTFLPFQPHEDVPKLYASSDVCLVPLRKGVTQDSVPSKVYTIMAAGKPIVASVDPGSDTWTFIQQTGCGICVEPERPARMASAIRALYRDRTLADRMGQHGRECVEARYTPRAAAEQYEELLYDVINAA